MSYDRLQLDRCLHLNSGTITTAANLAATAADWVVYGVQHPIVIRRISIFMTLACSASTTAPVVTVYSRPTTASSAGQVTIGTLTIPNATAAGKVVYKELNSVRVNAGNDLCLAVTTQGGGSGTAAGTGFIGLMYEMAPEVPADQPNMIASA
jgi:hypothetical protein